MKKIISYSLLTLMFSSSNAFSINNEEDKGKSIFKLYSNTIAICARAHQNKNDKYIKNDINKKFLEKHLDEPVDEFVLNKINEYSNDMSSIVEIDSESVQAKDTKDHFVKGGCLFAAIDSYHEMVKEKDRGNLK